MAVCLTDKGELAQALKGRGRMRADDGLRQRHRSESAHDTRVFGRRSVGRGRRRTRTAHRMDGRGSPVEGGRNPTEQEEKPGSWKSEKQKEERNSWRRWSKEELNSTLF